MREKERKVERKKEIDRKKEGEGVSKAILFCVYLISLGFNYIFFFKRKRLSFQKLGTVDHLL